MDIACNNQLSTEGIFIRSRKAQGVAKADIWAIHGYGESGLSFMELLNSKIPDLIKHYTIYVPDLPGCGVTPFQEEYTSLESNSLLLQQLIAKISRGKPVIIIGHSIGSVIGQSLCLALNKQVVLFISVEGFLIPHDKRYSQHFTEFENPGDLKKYLLGDLYASMKDDPAKQRYFASMCFCDPRILMSWAKSCYALAWSGRLLSNFLEIPCRKYYISGNRLTVEESTFLKEHEVEHIVLETGHWVMIDAPDSFCQYVHRMLDLMSL